MLPGAVRCSQDGLGLWAGPDSMQHIVAAGAEPGLVAVAERNGRVFVATSSTTAQADTSMTTGRVSVLDAHSGAVLRTIPVSGGCCGVRRG